MEINRAFGLRPADPFEGGQKKERFPRSDYAHIWLGREDSNLRITGPKPVALPLGYAPKAANGGAKSIVEQVRKVKNTNCLTRNLLQTDSLPHLKIYLKWTRLSGCAFARERSGERTFCGTHHVPEKSGYQGDGDKIQKSVQAGEEPHARRVHRTYRLQPLLCDLGVKKGGKARQNRKEEATAPQGQKIWPGGI